VVTASYSFHDAPESTLLNATTSAAGRSAQRGRHLPRSHILIVWELNLKDRGYNEQLDVFTEHGERSTRFCKDFVHEYEQAGCKCAALQAEAAHVITMRRLQHAGRRHEQHTISAFANWAERCGRRWSSRTWQPLRPARLICRVRLHVTACSDAAAWHLCSDCGTSDSPTYRTGADDAIFIQGGTVSWGCAWTRIGRHLARISRPPQRA
jgi:hypothetical protein